MHHGLCVDTAQEALLGSLADTPGPVVLVANEVGLGIVPDNAMARTFQDHAGQLNQAIAGTAGRVYFVVAGLPMVLKGMVGSSVLPCEGALRDAAAANRV